MKILTRPWRDTRFRKAAAYLVGRIQFRLYGVKYGRNLRAAGVELLNLGSIAVGNDVLLRSRPVGNPYTCGLRTYFPEAHIEIGDHVIMNGALIHCNCAVSVGAHTRMGPGVILCDNDSHPAVASIAVRDERPPEAPIRLGRNVWLGMRSIVLKGVTIGDNTIIAAGSVVTDDLPANVLAAGIPARKLRDLV